MTRYKTRKVKSIDRDGYGWGNGYIRIPKGHKWYGLDYQYIDKKYKGNEPITYARFEKNGEFWIGFDTCHYIKGTVNTIQDEKFVDRELRLLVVVAKFNIGVIRQQKLKETIKELIVYLKNTNK